MHRGLIFLALLLFPGAPLYSAGPGHVRPSLSPIRAANIFRAAAGLPALTGGQMRGLQSQARGLHSSEDLAVLHAASLFLSAAHAQS